MLPMQGQLKVLHFGEYNWKRAYKWISESKLSPCSGSIALRQLNPIRNFEDLNIDLLYNQKNVVFTP